MNEFADTIHDSSPAIPLNVELCTGCALCVDVCHGEALELVNGYPEVVRPDDCLCCGMCEEVCPTSARGLKEWPVIDWPRCTDCGLCAEICPRVVFALEGEEIAIASPQSCNSCGDCLEICPMDAIELVSEGGEETWRRQRLDLTKK